MSKDLNSKVDISAYNSKVTELQNSINSKASKSVATTSADGLMSSADKTKLNGIATNANNYSHPTSSGNKHIPSGGASGQFLKWSADGTAVWANDNNTTYTAGTGLSLSGTTFSANIGTGSSQVAAGNHTHNYLPLAGGTLTGSIKFSGGGYNNHAIRLEAGDANGAFVGIGAGGLTVIGSGESTNAVRQAITNGSDEVMVVASDQAIRFLTGVQNGYDSAKEVTITNTGVLNAPQGITGNASSATKLQTARSINGTNFDGSGNITTANWGTARTLTIGNTGKSVNGSGNISWSLSEIGALPLSGGSLTGSITLNNSTGGAIKQKLTTGTAVETLYITTGDNLRVGNASIERTFLYSKANPQTVVNGNTYTLYHTGNKPSASDVGALASGGTAVAANKLATARTITLSNHLSGSASFDGSANVTLSGTVRSASTSQTGIVQLNDATNSTSTSQAATANAVKKAYDLANGKISTAKSIPANDDLNNYKTEGFYFCNSSANAGTIKNVASSVAFCLLVERHAGCKQTFTTYDNNSPKMWYRNFYNGTWGAWQRVFDSFMVKNGESMGSITASKLSSPSGSALQLQAASGNILACSRIYPITDGDKELGVSGYRWLRVFAVNGTIQTSDRRYKTRIQNADELDCFEMIKNVDVCTYTMINKDKTKVKNEEELISLANAAEEDSTSTIQMGIIAQDLLPYECSKYILTHDITEKENGEISDIYGINPYNFSAAIMSALKTEISYRESLEEKVEELSQQIKKLQSN